MGGSCVGGTVWGGWGVCGGELCGVNCGGRALSVESCVDGAVWGELCGWSCVGGAVWMELCGWSCVWGSVYTGVY